MAAIVTSDIRVFNAQQFLESVSEPANASIYTFIGQPLTANATAATDNTRLQYDVWDNMIALKRINGGSDVKAGIRKYVWASGNTYTAYSHDNSNLYNTQFYVVNSSDNKIYKCIANNNGGASTVAPTEIAGTTTGNTAFLSDGYKWLYMADISGADLAKFGTPSFVPLTANSTTQTNALPGAILHIEVVNGGSGYTTQPTVVILGDGTGAVGNVKFASGAVSNIVMLAVGSGYTNANAFITGGGGSGANLKVSIAPPGGHGYSQYEELSAHYAILNTRVETSDTDFPTGISYYQVGLIRDPINRATGNVAYDSTLKAYKTLVFGSAITSLPQANVITGSTSGANAYVLACPTDATSNLHYFTNRSIKPNISYCFRSFQSGESVKNEAGGTVGTISYIANAEVIPYTGRLLYVDNRSAITRATNQSESISVILEF